MRARHTAKLLSDFAWSIVLLGAVLAFVWMVIAQPLFAAAWCIAAIVAGPLVIGLFHINRRDD